MEAGRIDDVAVAMVRSYLDAWMADDLTTVLESYHPDLTLEWSGGHSLAGVHVGIDASLDALLRLAVVTNRKPVEIVEVLVGERSIVALVVERWSDAEGSIDVERALQFEVRDGRIARCRILEADQRIIDDWFGARC